MIQRPATSPLFPNRGALWTITVFLGCAVLIAGMRFHTRNEPVERDIAIYSVIAHEMLQGRSLYSDLWDHKPPAVYLTYALAEKITGYGPWEIYFLGVVAALLALAGVYRLGAAGSMGRGGGLWAMSLWALLCSDLELQANQPNVEVFLNAALVWALVPLVSGREPRKKPLLAGSLLALGSFYKPQILALAFFYSLAFFLPQKERRSLSGALAFFLRLSLPSLILWGGAFLFFGATGRMGDFYQSIVVFNAYYSGNPLWNLVEGLRLKNLFPGYAPFLLPLLLLALAAWFKRPRVDGPPWTLWAAYGAGVYVGVAATGRFFPHYYQLWLPWLAVGGGWAVRGFQRGLAAVRPKVSLLPGLVVVALLFGYESRAFLLTPDQWAYRKYGQGPSEARELGLYLSGVLKPGEDFYFWGNEAGAYFYSRKSPPSGILYVAPALDGPLQGALSGRLMRDLVSKKPDLLITDNMDLPGSSGHFLKQYLFWENFPEDGHFSILVRKNSPLAGRLLGGSNQASPPKRGPNAL